jgi:hypothetical protein
MPAVLRRRPAYVHLAIVLVGHVVHVLVFTATVFAVFTATVATRVTATVATIFTATVASEVARGTFPSPTARTAFQC